MGRPTRVPKQDIVDTYAKLQNTKKVAKVLDCSQPYVYRVLKDFGIKMPRAVENVGAKPRRDPQEVIDCYKKLGKVKLVAKALGYSTQGVYGVFRRNGFNIKEYRRSLKD